MLALTVTTAPGLTPHGEAGGLVSRQESKKCYDKGMMTEPAPIIRPLSFAMELRLLIARHRRVQDKLKQEQQIYPDKGDGNGKES